MGMFDEVRFTRAMPDGFTAKGTYQTKDLACELDVYEVGDDDRLKKVATCFDGALAVPEDQDFHGWLRFYTFSKGEGCHEVWREYRAKFTDGNLVQIVVVEPNA